MCIPNTSNNMLSKFKTQITAQMAERSPRLRRAFTDVGRRVDIGRAFNTDRICHLRSLRDDSDVDAVLVLDRVGQFHAEIPKSAWGNLAIAVDLQKAWGAGWSAHSDFSTSVSLGRMDEAYIQYARPIDTGVVVDIVRVF